MHFFIFYVKVASIQSDAQWIQIDDSNEQVRS